MLLLADKACKTKQQQAHAALGELLVLWKVWHLLFFEHSCFEDRLLGALALRVHKLEAQVASKVSSVPACPSLAVYEIKDDISAMTLSNVAENGCAVHLSQKP